MILRADLYLSKGEIGDAGLQKATAAYMRKFFPENMRIPTVQSQELPTILQPVAKQALHIAEYLVTQFGLDYRSGDHLFSPMPWTNPGVEISVTTDIIRDMQAAAVKAV